MNSFERGETRASSQQRLGLPWGQQHRAGPDGGDSRCIPPSSRRGWLLAAIKDCSRRGDLVLDPSGGFGTTLIAAEKTGRSARLIEYDPAYCDTILRRFARVTGKQATLAATGETFEVVKRKRESVTPSEGSARMTAKRKEHPRLASVSDIETRQSPANSLREGQATRAGGRAKKTAPGIGGHSEFDALFLEELDRQVAVREGETVERMSVMRAAARAIALKAAKGDVKAYTALTAKRDAIEDRRRAHQKETLQAVLEYMDEATLELMRRKREGVSGPEIIPHPDDIDIDPKTGSIVLHGPLTADQKMAQDLMVSTWPAVEREISQLAALQGKGSLVLTHVCKIQEAVRTRSVAWWRGGHPRSIHGTWLRSKSEWTIFEGFTGRW